MKPRPSSLLQEAINEAVKALDAELVACRIHAHPVHLDRLAKATVRAYQKVATDMRLANADWRISPLTKTIASMKVGDTFTAVVTTRQTLNARIRTAKVLMDNPSAVFSTEQIRGTERRRVTRLPDGTKHSRDPMRNHKAVELASLRNAGDSLISKYVSVTRGRGMLALNDKIAARKILRQPGAGWSTRTTPRGVQITRTS